ncbi:MAG: elongation factor G [Ruminococcaceae bacterium]|nr:elongation factor G [Oscillospiraceae bacterium]
MCYTIFCKDIHLKECIKLKDYSQNAVRNVAILGHGGSGKTTLADAILFYGKATDRIGKISDSTTVMDFDAEEKKRKTSVSTSVYSLEIADSKLNIIDAPGLFDFAGGVHEALTAADSAIVTISGKSGLTVGAKQGFEKARALGKSVAFFVGKLDSSHAHFYRVLSALAGQYGAVICPVIVPYLENEQVKCYINLIENKAYACTGLEIKEMRLPVSEEIDNMRSMLLEAIATTDEGLMEKYFEGEEFTTEEMLTGLSIGVKNGDICPVYSGVQQNGDAVPMMVDNLLQILPATDVCTYKNADGEECAFDASGNAALCVFKTIADPFVGKLSYFKVLSGAIKNDIRLINNRTGEEERLSKIMWLRASKQEDASTITAGDIGAVAKLGNVLTGDTLSVKGDVAVAKIDFPAPNLSVAVYPKAKGDEEKIAGAFNRMAEEDPTIAVFNDKETKELILSALGEQHIDVIVSRLKSKFGAEVELKKPKIAYRETIRKTVQVQGRHKKQSGGHGQFGDVWIRFEPCDSDELVFCEEVFGGAVPKNFFPAVEKGLRDSCQKGVLAGYPMVGLKATLYDGSYHPVDSSEMSFKMAASIAYKDGIPQANPVLLEPIGTLKVLVPDEMLGDVIGDINKRRGRIIGMNPCDNKMQEIIGEVPIAEMSDFSTAMRSITQGTATFNLTFERYEDVPAQIAQKVIEAAKE